MADDKDKTLDINVSPQTAEDYSKRGWIYLTTHEGEKAVADFQTALSMNASDVYSAFGLGKALMTQGEKDDAIQAFDRAIALLDDGAFEEKPRADMFKNIILSERNQARELAEESQD